MSDDRHVDRRSFLRTGIGLGTAALAGCSGEQQPASAADSTRSPTTATTRTATTQSATAQSTATHTATDAGPRPGPFLDDFEDGSLTTDPAWTREFEPDSPASSARVVEQSAPDGGTRALRLTDATDEDSENSGFRLTTIRSRNAYRGWDGAWTLSGLVSPVAVPEGDEAVHQLFVGFQASDAGESARFLVLGSARTGGEERLAFLRDGWEAITEAPRPETDNWYRYELTHDGNGRLTGRRWPATGRREAAVSTTITLDAVPATASVSLSQVGGVSLASADPGSHPHTTDHAFVRWQPE